MAFRFSAAKLFESYSRIYFWTFTLKSVEPDWYYSNVWSAFFRALGDLYGGALHGLKVVELHKTHGLHWHALLNQRIWVGEVRRLAKRYGIGRVSVSIADRGSIDYLSKYVGKGLKRRRPLCSNAARWGTCGGFAGTRVRDLDVDSPFHRAVLHCQARFPVPRLPFIFASALLDKIKRDGQPSRTVLDRACARYMSNRSISCLWVA